MKILVPKVKIISQEADYIKVAGMLEDSMKTSLHTLFSTDNNVPREDEMAEFLLKLKHFNKAINSLTQAVRHTLSVHPGYDDSNRKFGNEFSCRMSGIQNLLQEIREKILPYHHLN